MEIKKTQRSKYLKCKQIRCDEIEGGTLISNIMGEWVGKVNKTRQKMKNIIKEDQRKHGGVLLTSYRHANDFMTDKERIEYLMDDMGVFLVPTHAAWNVVPTRHQQIKQIRPYIWYRNEPDYPGNSMGNEWYDYYGDDSITQSGGLVVVLLSDEGVEYLNRCAMKVGFRWNNLVDVPNV